jgi:hypothetical protein
MIHYHGTPITPKVACAQILAHRHAFLSFADPRDQDVVLEVCHSFALDNGAFSAWRSGNPNTDWSKYYEWVKKLSKHPSFDFALIPDVIDGTETDNDRLIAAWPLSVRIAVPVWHLHEGFGRLRRLAGTWPMVAFGSSGAYATVGSMNWWVQMGKAMKEICVDGSPTCRLHGLRMLNPRIFRYLPFTSADSTNVARNIGIDSAWSGSYSPPTKGWRGIILAERVEQFNSASKWTGDDQLERAMKGTI